MNWLDKALDDAEVYLEASESSLFELDYAGEGLKILRENTDVLSALTKATFAKTMILRAAGDIDAAREAVLGSNWESRKILRSAARDNVEDKEVPWSILGDIAVVMIKAVLPYVLAAVLED